MTSPALRPCLFVLLVVAVVAAAGGCPRRNVAPDDADVAPRVAPAEATPGAAVAGTRGGDAVAGVDEASAGPALETPAAAPPPLPEPHRRALHAGRIDDERLLMHGPSATGRFGDFVLRNARVHAIVSAPDHRPGLARSGGILADVGHADRRLDYFGHHATAAFADSNAFHLVEDVVVAHDGSDGRPAEVVASGFVPVAPELRFRTVYRLAHGDDSLEIDTTWTNTGEATAPELVPVDTIDWGQHATFLPYYGELDTSSEERIERESMWAAGRVDSDDTSMVFYSEQRAFASSHYRNVSSFSFGFRARESRVLGPGESLRLRRRLMPGTRDLAASTNRVLAAQGVPTGEMVGRAVDTSPDRRLVPHARIRVDEIRRGATIDESRPRLYTVTYSDRAGEFAVRLPAGEFVIRGDEPTRVQAPRNLSQFLEPGAVIEKELQMAPPYRLAFEVRDAETSQLLPCKLTIVPLRGSSPHWMGPAWQAPYARNTYYSITGRGLIDVPRGFYRIIITRGPEYTAHTEEVTIGARHAVEPHRVEATLRREVDTAGWVAVDLGSRTRASHDTLVSAEDRLVSAIAEGVEVIIPLDANVVTDLRPTIEQLGLGAWIRAGLGVQVRRPDRGGFGAFSVYPLPEDEPAEALAAAVEELRALETPAEAFAFVRQRFPGALIQVDEPTDPAVGYLARHGYDGGRDKPLYARFGDGYSDDYDLVEVLRGRVERRHDLLEALEPWYQLVLGGDVTKRFVATTGSRSIHAAETGYPRLFVRAATDDPAAVDMAELAASLRAGAMQITMGPFLAFDVNGAGPGSWVEPNEERWVVLDMRATAPAWLPVGFVEILKDGHLQNKALVLSGTYPNQFPGDDAKPFLRRTRPLRDWTLLLTAQGREETLEPYLPRMGGDAGHAPFLWAITGPVFVDRDRDGVFTPPAPSLRPRD